MITQGQFDRAVQAGRIEHRSDCEHIRAIANNWLGLNISLLQAQEIWEEHSERSAAGWLGLRDDWEIRRAIECFVERRLPGEEVDAEGVE